MDNYHAQEAEITQASGRYLVFNLGVLGRVGGSAVKQLSSSQCRVRQYPNTKTTQY